MKAESQGYSRVEFVPPSSKHAVKSRNRQRLENDTTTKNLLGNGSPERIGTNNEDLSDVSKMTQINLISGGAVNEAHSLSLINAQANLSALKSSQVLQPGTEQGSPRPIGDIITNEKSHQNCTNSNPATDFIKHNSEDYPIAESRTPVTKRQRDSFQCVDNQQINPAAIMSKKVDKTAVNRQLTMKQQSGIDGYQVSLTDVMSIGTKHRASFTQTQLSNDQNINSTSNVGQQPTTVVTGPDGQHVHNIMNVSQVSNNLLTTTGHGSMRQSSSFQNHHPAGMPQNSQHVVKLSNLNNEHIISIFDKDTEKSYLLERQVLVPTGLTGVAGAEHDKNGPSIFKVQEVGTAKFKCIPVTEYGKIMNIHRQKQLRKVQTADGQSRRNRQHQQHGHGNSSKSRRGRSMAIKTGITSQETFHYNNQYKGKFQSQNTASTQHKNAHNTANQAEKDALLQKRQTVWMQRCTSSEKNGGPIMGAGTCQLRNSKSSAISGQRKEVFSRTRIINEQGISITQRTAFKAHVPLSTTSSKAFGETSPQNVISGFLEDQNILKGINSANNFGTSRMTQQNVHHRTTTARTNVVRPIYIDKLKSNQTPGGHCCCPASLTADHNSSITIGTAAGGHNNNGTPSQFYATAHQNNHQPGCINCETLLTSSHRGGQQQSNAIRPHHEKKFMKKRAQSQGGVRMHSYPRSTDQSTLQTVTCTTTAGGRQPRVSSNCNNMNSRAAGLMLRQNRNHHLQQNASNTTANATRLMLIASDLRKNILPRQHEQINEIYKQRIGNYLSLLGIQGEANQVMTNKIFKANCASTDGNIDEEHINELLDQIKKQQKTQIAGNALNQLHMTTSSPLQMMQMNNLNNENGGALVAEDCSSNDNNSPEWDMVDNVRPLRTKIIESVRCMPSYYEGRIKKDPIKLKQFEMTMNSDQGDTSGYQSNIENGAGLMLSSNAAGVDHQQLQMQQLQQQQMLELLQNEIVAQCEQSGLDHQQAVNAARAHIMQLMLHNQNNNNNNISSNGTNKKTLQAALNETRQKLLQLNYQQGVPINPQQTDGTTVASNGVINRNKLNMMAISANEVDRMLYKKGLASPTVLKTCHNEMMRRAWANRRVSEKVTRLSNIQALIREHPPVSPLIKPGASNPVQLQRTAGNSQSPEHGGQNADMNGEILVQQNNNHNNNHNINEQVFDGIVRNDIDQQKPLVAGTVSSNGTIRKSLRLNQGMHQNSDNDLDANLNSINSGRNAYESNMSPMDEQESFFQLVPKQNQMESSKHQMNGGSLTGQTTLQQQFMDSNTDEHNFMNEDMPGGPYQSFGLARPTGFNDPKQGGQDLTHILNNKNGDTTRNGVVASIHPSALTSSGIPFHDITDLMIKGISPGWQSNNNSIGMPPHSHSQSRSPKNSPSPTAPANIESQKMVKTYEFHLPMHHIREEEQRSQAELYQSSSNYKTGIGLQHQASTNNASRYNLSKQSTVNRISKRKTGNLMPNYGGGKRDDISSQMLENETVADQQNSLRNLNLIGSSIYGDQTTNMRINQSQTAIRKRTSQTQNRSSNPAAHSFEATEEASSLKKRVTAGVVSQSIDMANQASYQQQIASGEERMDGVKANKIRNMLKKQALSNMTNRNGGPSPTETNSTRKRAHQIKRNATNKHSSSAARNSPLICLSQQELNERTKIGSENHHNQLQNHNNTASGQSSDPTVTFQHLQQQSSQQSRRQSKFQLHSLINSSNNPPAQHHQVVQVVQSGSGGNFAANSSHPNSHHAASVSPGSPGAGNGTGPAPLRISKDSGGSGTGIAGINHSEHVLLHNNAAATLHHHIISHTRSSKKSSITSNGKGNQQYMRMMTQGPVVNQQHQSSSQDEPGTLEQVAASVQNQSSLQQQTTDQVLQTAISPDLIQMQEEDISGVVNVNKNSTIANTVQNVVNVVGAVSASPGYVRWESDLVNGVGGDEEQDDDRQTKTAMMVQAEDDDGAGLAEETDEQTNDKADGQQQQTRNQGPGQHPRMPYVDGRYSASPPEAYLILHSSDGQSEVLEIAQRNFELFGKQLDSNAKLTGSSIATSDAARYTLAAVNSTKEDGFMNSNATAMQAGEFRLDVGEHQIEVVNISQAVQTNSIHNANNLSTQESPKISNLYVTRNNHTPTNITIGQQTQHQAQSVNQTNQASQISKPPSHNSGAESRLRYIERLLSETEAGQPRQTQVKMQQFQTKMPKRQTKSASGYPAVNRIPKQIRQHNFRQAQLYMPSTSLKAAKGELKDDMKGNVRFKTFRANNELYMRIDAVKTELENGPSDQKEVKAYSNALMQNICANNRNSLPTSTTNKETSTVSGNGTLDKGQQMQPIHSEENDQGSFNLKARNTRDTKFNTLEFMHKSDCPLHELEAFEAQEGLWSDQNTTANNLMMQDTQNLNSTNYNSDCLNIDEKIATPSEGINKVVYRKQSPNNGSKISKIETVTEKLQSQNETEDFKGQKSSAEDLSGFSNKYHRNITFPLSGDGSGQVSLIQPVQEMIMFQRKQKMSQQDKYGSSVKDKASYSNTTLVSQPLYPILQQPIDASELVQMNETITKQQQSQLSPSRGANTSKQLTNQGRTQFGTNGTRPTSIITQPVLQQVNKLGKTKKNSLDVEVKAAKATIQPSSVPVTPMTNKQMQPFLQQQAFQQLHQHQQPLSSQQTPSQQQRGLVARVKGGVKLAGQSSKKQSNAIQGHEFTVLGTNPAILKNGPIVSSQNKTISVPSNNNKRHIDVFEFGDKLEPSKSPGLGPESSSLVNQDLNFSLGIETQIEQNVQENSETVQSHEQSLNTSPSLPNNKSNLPSHQILLPSAKHPQQIGSCNMISSNIIVTRPSATQQQQRQDQANDNNNPLQNRRLSSNAPESNITIGDEDDVDQDHLMRQNQPMKPKRTWRGNKSKKGLHPSNNNVLSHLNTHHQKQEGGNNQLRMTNMVLQVYADKKNTPTRRPLYSNTQYAGGVSNIAGSVTAGSGLNNGPMQKRGSNQDIPFELSFNYKHHHRSKTNTNNVNKMANTGPNRININAGSVTQNAQYQRPQIIKDYSATSSQRDMNVISENAQQQAMSNNPDVLKNILKSKAAPVVVPRQNDGMYQGVKSQGLDRAINYINYEQSQRARCLADQQQQQQQHLLPYHHQQQLIIDEQEKSNNPTVVEFILEQQQSSSNYRRQNHADGGITAGFGSLDSSAYNNTSNAGGVHPLIKSLPNSQRSQQQPLDKIEQPMTILEADNHHASLGSVGYINQAMDVEIQHNERKQQQLPAGELGHQANFGSMIRGKPCLEQTSLNQAHLQKYQQALIVNQIQRYEEMQPTTLLVNSTPQSNPSITYQEMVTSSQRDFLEFRQKNCENVQGTAYKMNGNQQAMLQLNGLNEIQASQFDEQQEQQNDTLEKQHQNKIETQRASIDEQNLQHAETAYANANALIVPAMHHQHALGKEPEDGFKNPSTQQGNDSVGQNTTIDNNHNNNTRSSHQVQIHRDVSAAVHHDGKDQNRILVQQCDQKIKEDQQ